MVRARKWISFVLNGSFKTNQQNAAIVKELLAKQVASPEKQAQSPGSCFALPFFFFSSFISTFFQVAGCFAVIDQVLKPVLPEKQAPSGPTVPSKPQSVKKAAKAKNDKAPEGFRPLPDSPKSAESRSRTASLSAIVSAVFVFPAMFSRMFF